MEERLHLQLSPDERQVLRDVLWEYLGDLRMEIVDTEAHDFREELKRREAILKSVLGRLGQPVP
jgi:hypothetical protein